MVRRLLLTALTVLLAIAMPTAAEETASNPEPATASCPPLDAACLAGQALPDCHPWDLLCSTQSAYQWTAAQPETATSCALFALDLTNSSTQPLALDPDGCVREFVRRTLGWPPLEPVAPGSILPFGGP